VADPDGPYAGYVNIPITFDGSGNLLWNTFLGSGAGDEGYGIAVTGGTLFLTGYSGSGWGSPIDP